MKQKFSIGAIGMMALVMPSLAAAQSGGDLTSFVITVQRIVNMLVPLVSTLAIVFFFYGLAMYILNSGNEEKKAEGRSIMIWGVLALFVLVTIWGIIGFLQKTVGNTAGPVGDLQINIPDISPSVSTYNI